MPDKRESLATPGAAPIVLLAGTLGPLGRCWQIAPGVDFSQACRSSGGDLTLLESILRIFLKHHARLPIELDALLAASQLAEARRVAHAIGSVARTLGAQRLDEAADTLEQKLCRFTHEEADVLAVKHAMSELITALELSQYAHTGDDRMFDQLDRLLARADRTSWAWLSEYAASLGQPVPSEYTEICRLARYGDYGSAREKLQRWWPQRSENKVA
jgi:HPt (histidine-containing phosphotransfer) domain-containing protein